MYLAREQKGNKTHYSIRESFREDGCWKSRHLFDLGTDPSAYIIYPGGHGYYYHESIEDAFAEKGATPGPDDLDTIFWDFLDPEIKRVIEGFQRPGSRQRRQPKPTDTEPRSPVHLFDRRRIHFLRCGQIDQRHIGRVPTRFFKAAWYKSRDEIEQMITKQERELKAHERAVYVYAIFDLQRFFSSPFAKQNPGALDREALDRFFIESVCELNEDGQFWKGTPETEGLQPFLVKYVIMYFDSDFVRPAFVQDYIEDFINRRRRYIPPEKVKQRMKEAGDLFETTFDALKQMNRRELTHLYRKLAMRHHPDQGGRQETFVRLTETYQILLKGKRTDR
jgi:hypothetical protein